MIVKLRIWKLNHFSPLMLNRQSKSEVANTQQELHALRLRCNLKLNCWQQYSMLLKSFIFQCLLCSRGCRGASLHTCMLLSGYPYMDHHNHHWMPKFPLAQWIANWNSNSKVAGSSPAEGVDSGLVLDFASQNLERAQFFLL